MESIKNWMRDAANILFDDSKNDLRALPKTVRLQILLVLSFIWTTVFSLYVFSYTTFAFGWIEQKKSLRVFFEQKILILLK